MNLSKNKSLILLHIIIFIWGFTGILGKIINLSSESIVWNRMTIAFISLFIISLFKKLININIKSICIYCFIGLLIAIHWIFFFESIKLSTVSLALICLSSGSLFTAILEPLFQNRKIRLYELLLSTLVIIGIVIVFNYEILYHQAIILAILSALFAALFTVMNHKLIQKGHSAINITLWEMFGGAIALTLYLISHNKFTLEIIPVGVDVLYIIILGLICTAFAFYGSVEVMKKLTPFTVNLSVNLEPIYAIILAIIFFGEEERMSNQFYIGAFIIISSVMINTIIKRNAN